MGLLPCKLPAADNLFSGARAAGLSNATIAIFDFWAITHNQAGITRISVPAAGIYTENRFLLKELSLVAAAVIYPTTQGHFGFSFQYFGSSLYGEGKAGLAYARHFGDKLSAGVKLSYMFTAIGEHYGSAGTAVAEAGIIYELTPGLFIGTHIFNPHKARLKTRGYLYGTEYIPGIIRTGIAYHISETVLICLEAEKDLRHIPGFKAGVEYSITDRIAVRAGISNEPAMNAFGFGIQTETLQIDISASYHHILGYSPQSGLIYSFR